MSHAKGLSDLAEVAATIAPVLGGLPGVVAGIAATALRAGAALAAAGKDPVVEITRILSSDPAVSAVLDERESLLDDKFGPADSP